MGSLPRKLVGYYGNQLLRAVDHLSHMMGPLNTKPWIPYNHEHDLWVVGPNNDIFRLDCFFFGVESSKKMSSVQTKLFPIRVKVTTVTL